MNKNILVALILLIIILLITYILIGRKNDEIESNITFPKGREELVAGMSYKITWNHQEDGSPPKASTTNLFLVDRSLLDQGVSVSVIDRKYGIPNTGSYNYVIPSGVQESEYFFIIGTTTGHIFKIVVRP